MKTMKQTKSQFSNLLLSLMCSICHNYRGFHKQPRPYCICVKQIK
jgi:hypothetical protein